MRRRALASARRARIALAARARRRAATTTTSSRLDDRRRRRRTDRDTVTDVSLVAGHEPSGARRVACPARSRPSSSSPSCTAGTGQPAARATRCSSTTSACAARTATEFDNNYGAAPFPVTLGAGGVIAGLGAGPGRRRRRRAAAARHPGRPRLRRRAAGRRHPAGRRADVRHRRPRRRPGGRPGRRSRRRADLPAAERAVTEPSTSTSSAGDGAVAEVGQTGVVHLVASRGDDGEVLAEHLDVGEPQRVHRSSERRAARRSRRRRWAGMKVGGRRGAIPSDVARPRGNEQLGLAAALTGSCVDSSPTC